MRRDVVKMAKQKGKRQIPPAHDLPAATETKRGCIGNLVHQLRTLSIAGWVVICGGVFVLGQIGQMQQQERAPTQTVQAMTLVAMSNDLTLTAAIRTTANALLNATAYAAETATAGVIMTVTQTATAEILPSPSPTVDPVRGAIEGLPEVESADLVDVRGDQVYLELIVMQGSNTSATADAVYAAVLDALGVDALAWFSVILNDGVSATDYVRDDDGWRETQLRGQSALPVTVAMASAMPRPRNCATAVAMGLSAVQAAQWSHLDRDSDGVACYGD